MWTQPRAVKLMELRTSSHAFLPREGLSRLCHLETWCCRTRKISSRLIFASTPHETDTTPTSKLTSSLSLFPRAWRIGSTFVILSPIPQSFSSTACSPNRPARLYTLDGKICKIAMFLCVQCCLIDCNRNPSTRL